MDIRIKNALGAVGVVAMALITIAVWSWASAFARSAPAGATFSVTGTGKSVGIPDVAQFNFSVTTEGGKDIAKLQKDNTEKTNAAIAFVKEQGVEAKDIETLGYNIMPRYQSYNCAPTEMLSSVRPCPPSEIVGYTVTQTVQVKMRDFDKTGDIIAGVTERGANEVSGLNFTTDDPTGLENEARAEAIKNAKSQAEMMAKAGGFRLGRLVSVSEGYGYRPVMYEKSMTLGMGGDAAAALPAPSIEPGSDKYEMQVILTYEIR